MEPLSIFSVVVNVVQLVDFGIRLVREAQELHQSSAGQKSEHVELHEIASNLSHLCDNVPTAPYEESSLRYESYGYEMSELAKSAKRVADELMAAISKLKLIEGPQRRWRSFRQALTAVWHKDEIDKLHRRLKELRSALQYTISTHVL